MVALTMVFVSPILTLLLIRWKRFLEEKLPVVIPTNENYKEIVSKYQKMGILQSKLSRMNPDDRRREALEAEVRFLQHEIDVLEAEFYGNKKAQDFITMMK